MKKTTLLTKCLAGLAASLVLAALACNQGAEGDRCNPDLAPGHDECGSGLACTIPVDCPEAYCCPTSGTSSNAFCQPGCNGGAASACNAGDVDACALACTKDPEDLSSPDAQCAPATTPDAGADARTTSPEAGRDSGTTDGGAD